MQQVEANFYIRGYRGSIDPSFHIGKAYWQDGQEGLDSFVWAMNPDNFLKTQNLQAPPCSGCDRAFNDPENCIEDDYGRKYTMQEFKEMIQACLKQPREKVGTEFS